MSLKVIIERLKWTNVRIRRLKDDADWKSQSKFLKYGDTRVIVLKNKDRLPILFDRGVIDKSGCLINNKNDKEMKE